jgi:peptide/nickel transport system permease protein
MKVFRQITLRVSDYSQVPIWRKAHPLDLICVGYGMLVALMVLGSYFLGASGRLPFDPQAIDMNLLNAPPWTQGHLLGTDFLGRDIFSRLVLGIQAYFLPGLLAITIALTLGGAGGLVSGYRSGRWDRALTYVANLMDAVPRLVLILLMIAAFKPDIYLIMVVVGLTHAPTVASMVKSKVIFLKQQNFIESAVCLGLKNRTIIVKHILWHNCRALLIIQATLGMAEAILIETSLSYLGFGVQEPMPSWGNMVQSGANYFLQGAFWPSTAPALAILFTILGFHLLGDGLNNILERKQR